MHEMSRKENENLNINVQIPSNAKHHNITKVRIKAETPKFPKKTCSSPSPSVFTFLSTQLSAKKKESSSPCNSSFSSKSQVKKTPTKGYVSSNSSVSSVTSWNSNGSQASVKSNFSTSSTYLNEVDPIQKEKLKLDRARKTEEKKMDARSLKLHIQQKKELARQSLAFRLNGN
jgi:hypothetical protein